MLFRPKQLQNLLNRLISSTDRRQRHSIGVIFLKRGPSKKVVDGHFASGGDKRLEVIR